MSQLQRITLIACLIFASMVSAQEHYDAPSKGAKDLPGAKGTFAFKPTDWIAGEITWWKDTDGVAPDIAGCHVATDEEGNLNGRTFGEACLENGLLVESNPGKGVLHSHGDDTGHPDVFDCDAWCVGTGNSSGMCMVAQADPCGASAMCQCQ